MTGSEADRGTVAPVRDLRRVEHSVARILAETDRPVEVYEATLEAIEGRRLNFRVSVSDGHGLVAAGRITRVIVERARFMEKAAGD